MIPTLFVDDSHIQQFLDKVGPTAQQRLDDALRPIASGITSDAQARAQAHIRFLGVTKPGSKWAPQSYVGSIKGGVSRKNPKRITGYVRSAHPLAHLLELGFTITDMTIVAKVADVMAFDGPAGKIFREAVHRHETHVQPYPAINPAFEARRGDILAALGKVAKDAGKV